MKSVARIFSPLLFFTLGLFIPKYFFQLQREQWTFVCHLPKETVTVTFGHLRPDLEGLIWI